MTPPNDAKQKTSWLDQTMSITHGQLLVFVLMFIVVLGWLPDTLNGLCFLAYIVLVLRVWFVRRGTW